MTSDGHDPSEACRACRLTLVETRWPRAWRAFLTGFTFGAYRYDRQRELDALWERHEAIIDENGD